MARDAAHCAACVCDAQLHPRAMRARCRSRRRLLLTLALPRPRPQVLPPIGEKKFTKDFPACKILVTGAGGFIGSHLAKRLKEEGHFVRAVDWKENEYMTEDMFCNEFLNLDLRWPDNCTKAVEGMDWCFNLAADMGGMGFIQSNHSRILFNSTMISFNVAEAARVAGVKRFWYASSACIYPEYKQLDENLEGASGLKEEDAWPAQPQDAYGLEKLMTEELLMHYDSGAPVAAPARRRPLRVCKRLALARVPRRLPASPRGPHASQKLARAWAHDPTRATASAVLTRAQPLC